MFLKKLQPDMIGIGPYLTHHSTPFRNYENGSLAMTLRLIAILRLLFPYALIPSTTALGTIHPNGREMGLKAGANVVMPNVNDTLYRDKYQLYPGKICLNDEAEKCRKCVEAKITSIGRSIATTKGFRGEK